MPTYLKCIECNSRYYTSASSDFIDLEEEECDECKSGIKIISKKEYERGGKNDN